MRLKIILDCFFYTNHKRTLLIKNIGDAMNNIPNNKITRDCAMKMREAADTIGQLNELVRKCIGIIDASKTQLQVKETELDEYKKALEARVMEVENKKSEICSLNKKQEQLEIEKKQAEEELGRFKMIIDSTTKSLEEINSLILTTDSSKLSSSASIDLLIDSIKTSIGDLKSQVDDLKQQQLNVKGLEEKQENLIAEKDNEIQRLTEANRKAENELGNANSRIGIAVQTMQKLVSVVSSITGVTFAGEGLDATVEFLDKNTENIEKQTNEWKGQNKVIAEKDNEIQRLTEANRKAENELGNANSRIGITVQTMQKLVSAVSSITDVTFTGEGLDAMVEFLDKNTENIEKRINEWKDQSKVIAEKDNETHESIESNEEAENELKNSKFGTSDATRLMKNFVDVIRLITGCKDKVPQKIGTIIDFIHNNIDNAERLIDGWLDKEISKGKECGLLTTEEFVGQEAGSPNMMISATEKALKRFASMLSSITGRTFAGDDFDDIKSFIDENIDIAKDEINKLQEQKGVAKRKHGSVKKSDRSCRTPGKWKNNKKSSLNVNNSTPLKSVKTTIVNEENGRSDPEFVGENDKKKDLA